MSSTYLSRRATTLVHAALVACLVLLAAACGDSKKPPAALSYVTTAAVYTRDVAIVANAPSVTGAVSEWAVRPALPAGLSLDRATGVLAGTPTVVQRATTYIVTARNGGGATTATISIAVNDAAPTALSYGTTAAVYTKDAEIAPNVATLTGSATSWSIDPALPAGLALDATTGTIRGTPTALQAAVTYTVTATNETGATTAALSITISDAAPTALVYGTTAAVYTLDTVIAPNAPTVTGTVSAWSIEPMLPAGLALDDTTGVITGTPEALQVATSYVVTATNTGGSTTAAIAITINDEAPTALSYVTTAAVYTKDVVISANAPTVTGSVVAWSISPDLPAGLVLDTTTGVISGTPTDLQPPRTYVVTATNSGGATTATLSITVNDEAPAALSYASTAAIYTKDVVIASNTPSVVGSVVSYSVSPALPAGLVLDTTTGVISGTPAELQTAHAYVVTASNTGGGPPPPASRSP